MNILKYFYFNIFFKKILKKDIMSYKINKYRKTGATIGVNVRTFSPIVAAEPYLISIGNNVTISTEVKFITHDNSIIKVCDHGTDLVGEITIGDNCFIGQGTILLPGVSLGDNVIVGAGSVIAKSVLIDGAIVAGNPAKVIGSIENLCEKYEDNAFDFKGLTKLERKVMIENNTHKLLKK